MPCRLCFRAVTSVILIAVIVFVLSAASWSAEAPKPAPEPEQELVIVKYGSVLVKSHESGARVYIDETYKGGVESIVESVIAGDHVISCKTDDKSVSGTFHVKKNEMLKLEARFDEGKLVLYKEPAKTPEAAVEEKKKPEPVKQEKPKKPTVEPKKVEQKNPVEERRKTHLNVMRLNFEVTDSQDVRIEHAANQNVISKYTVKKNTAGKYYRTKQGILLCDAGPCEMTWSATFVYTDETGKTDALLLNWKETVFNGITPAGTSRQDLECCLNGQCWKMQDDSKNDAPQEYEIGRYRLSWTKTSVQFRRSDIMKEVIEAGRSLSDY
jgi:hypothetical protein